MTNEADRKRALVKAVNKIPGAYARRHEDRYAVGLLDLVIKLPGHPIVFAEGKIIKGYLWSPTERQFLEGERIQAAGMLALLIGWWNEFMYVSPWVQEANRSNCFTIALTPGPDILHHYLEQHS